MPGRGKVESSQASCSGYSGYLPRPECPGLAPGSSSALPQRPSPRRIPKASQLLGSASCLGKPSRRPGARGAAPDRPRGKVRAGPFHADAGGLCQQFLAYLPPPWLFAFGEAPAGWGLGRPERRSLGAGRAFERPSAPAQRGGEAGQRHQGTAATAPGVLAPADGAPGLGRRTSSAHGR